MPTTAHVPLILIRGFGGFDIEDERQVAYQGFNDGTVYPQKRGENYIYEGPDPQVPEVALAATTTRPTSSATTRTPVAGRRSTLPDALQGARSRLLHRHRVLIDAGTALELVDVATRTRARACGCSATTTSTTGSFKVYGEALVRLIDFVRDLTVDQDRASRSRPSTSSRTRWAG